MTTPCDGGYKSYLTPLLKAVVRRPRAFTAVTVENSVGTLEPAGSSDATLSPAASASAMLVTIAASVPAGTIDAAKLAMLRSEGVAAASVASPTPWQASTLSVPGLVPTHHSYESMLDSVSKNPSQFACTSNTSVPHSWSPPATTLPSITSPRSGSVRSSVTPLLSAEVDVPPALFTARTRVTYVLPCSRGSAETLTWAVVPARDQSRTTTGAESPVTSTTCTS